MYFLKKLAAGDIVSCARDDQWRDEHLLESHLKHTICGEVSEAPIIGSIWPLSILIHRQLLINVFSFESVAYTKMMADWIRNIILISITSNPHQIVNLRFRWAVTCVCSEFQTNCLEFPHTVETYNFTMHTRFLLWTFSTSNLFRLNSKFHRYLLLRLRNDCLRLPKLFCSLTHSHIHTQALSSLILCSGVCVVIAIVFLIIFICWQSPPAFQDFLFAVYLCRRIKWFICWRTFPKCAIFYNTCK